MEATDPGHRDRVAATTVTLLIHVLMFWGWWPSGSAPGGRTAKEGLSSPNDALTVVEFTTVKRAVPSSQPPSALKAVSAAEVEPEPTVEDSTVAPVNQFASPEPPGEKLAENVADGSEGASGASAAGAQQDDLRVRYRAAVRETITAYWKQLAGKGLPAGCVLQVNQAVGGQVISAYVDGCALSQDERLQLEAATLMAQPLPYVGFESVFVANLMLTL